MDPRHRNHEVVVLVLKRNKAEVVPTSRRLDSQTPVGATLRYSHGNGGMGLLLPPIAGGPIAGKQPVYQDPRATPRVAAHHPTAAVCERSCYGGLCREPLKPRIPPAEGNSLQATVAANEFHPR
jgi:hypothetical protein